jgi:DNA-binding protein HU-beta
LKKVEQRLGPEVHVEGKLVNKSQLIDALAARYEGNRTAARQALESVLDTITREVAQGKKVSITGFGSFERRVRNARWVRNPQTGERIKAKKTAVPKFTAGQDLKNVISGAKKLAPLPKPSKTAAATSSAAKKTTAKASASAKKTVSKSTGTAKKTAKKAPAKKAPAKKTVAKSTSAAKKTAKKAPARKTAAKSTSTAKKTAAKSTSTAKKTAAKSTSAAKKTTARSTSAAKKTAKKAPAKKTAKRS